MKGTLCPLRPMDQEQWEPGGQPQVWGSEEKRDDGVGKTWNDNLWGPNRSEQPLDHGALAFHGHLPGAVTPYGVLEYPLTGVPTGWSTSLPLTGT